MGSWVRNFVFLALFASVLLYSPYFTNDVFAQTQPNLYVSAENPLFDNSFAGPMVIEVVVIDEDIDDTTTPQAEPDVIVNGDQLRMVQGVDGAWYGYFADDNMAPNADATVGLPGFGLDFGEFCQSTSLITGIALDETDAFAIPRDIASASNGNEPFGICDTSIEPTDALVNHVVRESRAINTNPAVPVGQVGLDEDAWPLIQLFDFTVDGTVEVKYNKGNSVQQIDLVYLDDADGYADGQLDRTSYPQGAEVHFTVTDLQLNIDPTDEDSWTFGTDPSNPITMYQVFDENGAIDADGSAGAVNINSVLQSSLNFDDNGVFIIDPDSTGFGTNVINIEDNEDQAIIAGASIEDAVSVGGTFGPNTRPVTFTEIQSNSGIFKNTDEADKSNLVVTDDALRGTTATIDYNDSALSILVQNFFGTINIDNSALGGQWNSGEEAPLILNDGDANLNTLVDEDLDIFNPDVKLIPAMQLGNPFTLNSLNAAQLSGTALTIDDVQAFSERALLTLPSDIVIQNGDTLILTLGDTFSELYSSINEPVAPFRGFNYFNYDIRSIDNNLGNSINSFDVEITDGTNTAKLGDDISSMQGFFDISGATGDDVFAMNPASSVQLIFTFDVGSSSSILSNTTLPIVVDFFSFGIINDGALPGERINNMILRAELEETGDNTGIFEGQISFVMLNQLNILDSSTYENLLDVINDDVVFIAHQGLTDENSPRINYLDLGADGVFTQIADQEEAPSHSGVVSFDSSSYKVGERVDVTLEDHDLNTSQDIIDIFTVVNPSAFPSDPARDTAGSSGLGLYTTVPFGEFGRVVDITFDGHRWSSGLTENGGACGLPGSPDDGLFVTGFTLVETSVGSGVFTGDFDVPQTYCNPVTGLLETITGTDIGVNYVDYTDASNDIVEVGDSAGIRANTGVVSLDRTSYPIPFGNVDDFFPGQLESDSPTPDGDSIFPVHVTGVTADGDLNIDAITEEISPGDLVLHVRITDDDFNIQNNLQDEIAFGQHGPLEIKLSRGSETLLLATAGGAAPVSGVITTGTDFVPGVTRELGPIFEISPDSGIFEIDLPVRYTDGPIDESCPLTPDAGYESLNGNSGVLGRFDIAPASGSYCILSTDTIFVEYNDPADASGSPNTVTDSASVSTFDGVISTDKTIYIIGGDMIFTYIDSDFNLDSDTAETYDLDLIEWDSDAATLTIGDLGGELASFNPAPLHMRETGDSSGIFQVVIEIPQTLGGVQVQDGEEITLTITDWSPNGASYVGEQSSDATATIFTETFNVSVMTDSSEYEMGQTATVSGFVTPIFTFQPVTITITNPDDVITSITQTNPLSDGTYSQQFAISGPLWNEIGTYSVDVNYFTASANTTFDVVLQSGLFCNGMTVDELIASGIYPPANIFDNRDGSLGTNFKGTNGDDLMIASDAGNIMNGRNGNDCMIGGAGDDAIRGANGDDEIYGEGGNDALRGDNNDDVINGGDGDDEIRGGSGNDTINGNGGDDNLIGNNGDDAINGGDGNDVVNGGGGNDTIHGNNGIDYLRGNNGDDSIFGDDGNDIIKTEGGVNSASGGDDDDLIFGGKSNDVLNGDNGDDVILGQGGQDVINGGPGNDKLIGHNDVDTINGGNGDDFIDGKKGVDVCDGGTGSNFVINCP